MENVVLLRVSWKRRVFFVRGVGYSRAKVRRRFAVNDGAEFYGYDHTNSFYGVIGVNETSGGGYEMRALLDAQDGRRVPFDGNRLNVDLAPFRGTVYNVRARVVRRAGRQQK